jgi:hypothetical protein
MRDLAARLRSIGREMAEVVAGAQDRTTLPRMRGGLVARFRDAMSQRRERGARLERRLELLAGELDRGADWLEQAQRDAALANRLEGEGYTS